MNSLLAVLIFVISLLNVGTALNIPNFFGSKGSESKAGWAQKGSDRVYAGTSTRLPNSRKRSAVYYSITFIFHGVILILSSNFIGYGNSPSITSGDSSKAPKVSATADNWEAKLAKANAAAEASNKKATTDALALAAKLGYVKKPDVKTFSPMGGGGVAQISNMNIRSEAELNQALTALMVAELAYVFTPH